MGTACRRSTRQSMFVLRPFHHPNYRYYGYSLFILCCLAALVAPSIAELTEETTTTVQGCSQAERDALLAFKSSIQGPSNVLSSWSNQSDCCGWNGVVCRNDTITTKVHVVELELMNLRGDMLSPSLLSLTHLEGLDLRSSDFGGTQIPEFIGSFQKLRRLHLQECNFGGIIPPQLGNLSSLHRLGLIHLGESDFIRVKSLDWLSRLSSLTHLYMSAVDLNVTSHNWLPTINMLPSLQDLRLLGCNLNHIPTSLSHLNLTNLAFLEFGGNKFKSILPNWLWQLTGLSTLYLYENFHGIIPAAIGNLSNLIQLDLSGNSLLGPLPNELGRLTRLTLLDLSSNLLEGPLPNELGSMVRLTLLDLSSNLLKGPIPIGIGNLTSLVTLQLSNCSLTGPIPIEVGNLFNLSTLDLSINSLEGIVSQLHFTNLSNLLNLDLSHNSLLSFEINHNWVPPFQLESLVLNSLKLGPKFPSWLHSQHHITTLILSNANIEDNLPNWFWNSSTLVVINLSYNNISGYLPLSLENLTNLRTLNLNFNLLEGPIPRFPPSLAVVDLSFNSLSGPLPLIFSSSIYILSYNQIHGSIPSSICNSKYLLGVDFSYNQISGEIPQCEWSGANYLSFVHLGNNNLTGEIPSSIGHLKNIAFLGLNNNNLYGQIPSLLQNCSKLQRLDLRNNKLSGNIPIWVGQRLQQLTVLRLRSNMFSGDIPPTIGQLSNLQIIDFANNHLIGSIPHSLGNLSAIISTSRTMISPSLYGGSVAMIGYGKSDVIHIVTKGREYSISNIIYLVKSIDLSNNNLVGEIPDEFGSFVGLQTFNLSRNYLKGNIPNTISGMKSLETLDLSYNGLSGAIPQGLSALNYLSFLNLSYNNLSGVIPQGYQLQTLQDASIYIGNAYLCGALVNKSCSGDKNKTMVYEEHEDSSKMMSIYLSTTLGFLSGLWSVLVIILFKKEWRNFYFMLIDKLYDKAYVQIKIRLNRLAIKK